MMASFVIERTGGNVQIVAYGMYRTQPPDQANLPPDRTTKFTQDDEAAWLWFRFETDVNVSLVVRWIRPNGIVYRGASKNASYLLEGGYYVWISRLEIAGKDAAKYLGDWTVRVTTDIGTGELEAFRQTFTIAGVVYEERDYELTVRNKQDLHVEIVKTFHMSRYSTSQVNFGISDGEIKDFKVYDYESREELTTISKKDGDKLSFQILLKTARSGDFKILLVFDVERWIRGLGWDDYLLPWSSDVGLYPVPERYTVKIPPGLEILDVGPTNQSRKQQDGSLIFYFDQLIQPYDTFSWYIKYRAKSPRNILGLTEQTTPGLTILFAISIILLIVGIALSVRAKRKRARQQEIQIPDWYRTPNWEPVVSHSESKELPTSFGRDEHGRSCLI